MLDLCVIRFKLMSTWLNINTTVRVVHDPAIKESFMYGYMG